MSPVPFTILRLLILVLGFALADASLIPASAADVPPAKAAKPKLELRPRKDPTDIAFRRAPMVSATRTVLIPLATNLHIAFDTENLNTHAAWSGDSPNLWGSVYHISKDRFYIDYDGRTLWSQPGVFPWKSRKLEKEGFTNSVPTGRFLGISTKDDATTVVYELSADDVPLPVLVEECFRHRANVPDTLIERRLEIAPSKRSLTFLAHAETGTLLKAPDKLPVVLIDRGTNVLLVAARGTSALKLESVVEEVDYKVPVWREQKNDSILEYRQVTGKQARAYVRIPAHTNDIAVEILSLVASNADSALEMLRAVPKTKIDPPNMAFLTSRESAKKPSPPVVVDGDKAFYLPAGDESYRIEAFPLPKALEMQVTGMDFLPDGNLIVCTWLGDIYIVEKPTGPVADAKYRRFARGLCEPGGIKVVKGKVYVVQKQELTLVADTDGNGEADLFHCVSQDWGFTGNYHDFTFGPAVDKSGNFYLMRNGNRGVYDVPLMGWCLKIDPEGRSVDPFASGFRSPNGFASFGPDKGIFMCDNQGNWMGACTLTHVQRGRFYGFPSTKPAPREDFEARRDGKFSPPAVWFPYKLAKSVSGIAPVETDQFGPFQGQMIVGDFQNAILTRVQLERVNGEWQGAVWPFAKGFGSGVNRMVFGPDKKLYVGGVKNNAWAAVAPKESSLDRVSFTGKMPFEVREVHARADGFDLNFTQPVDPAIAANIDSYDVLQYRYHYHQKYGSPEYDQDDKENSATVIKVISAEVWDNGMTVRLKLAGLKPGYVTMVRCLDVANKEGRKLRHDTFWYTLNQVPLPAKP